jgi:UDP-glucose 4-epimerase
VTGGTGFVGSALIRLLVEKGYQVGILCRPGADTVRLGPAASDVAVIGGDLRDAGSYREALRLFRPDTLYHLAWRGMTGAERDDPRQVDWNLYPTLELFRAASESGVGTWVGLGSVAEYGAAAGQISEETPAKPRCLYGAVKASVNLLSQRLAAIAGIRHFWLRLFAAYGPGDNPGWLIPTIARELLEGGEPRLTEGLQAIDLLHVRDAAAGLLAVGESGGPVRTFNLGSGKGVTVRAVAEKLRDLLSPNTQLHFGAVPYAAGEPRSAWACIDSLRGATGWSPTIPLDDGLAEAAAWFRGEPVHGYGRMGGSR